MARGLLIQRVPAPCCLALGARTSLPSHSNRRMPPMKVVARPLLLVGLGGVLFAGCGGSGGGGQGSSQMRIEEVSNGFGRLLPYEIAVRDSEGNPTSRVIEISSIDDLVSNVTQANPIRPPTKWPIDMDGNGNPILPSNLAGNQDRKSV